MENRKICTNDHVTNPESSLSIILGCKLGTVVYPCKKCGVVIKKNSDIVTKKDGRRMFFLKGQPQYEQ